MFGRYSKTLTSLLVLFLVFFTLGSKVPAAYLCPQTLISFDTLEECQNFCPGANCIESGTYMCSADTDGDGETELYQCQQVYQCPLGDYPCNDGICVAPDQTEYATQTHIFKEYSNLDSGCGKATQNFASLSGKDNCLYYSISHCDDCAGCSGYSTYVCFQGVSFSGKIEGRGGSFFEIYLNISPNRICNRYDSSQCVTISGGTFESNLPSLDTRNGEYQGTSTSFLIPGNYYIRVRVQKTASCIPDWECPITGGSECVDVSVSENYKDESPDLSYYQDDGPTDPETGQCLGQILIFNGRPMMCRRSGMQTGFHNCCDADDEVVQELNNQLLSLGGTFAVISKLKDAISLASQTYKAYQALSSGVSAIDVASNFNWSTTAINSAIDAFNAGKSVTDAMSSALQVIGITPTGIITNIAINFAMDFAIKILFSGCSEDDIITAAYNKLGLCHYIGKKCVKKLPIIGCVQKANIYCCFNSKLARIIQEQGRAQLKTIDGWGSTDYPNCRGLTPQEFQNLDFSRMDLYEWQEDIKTQSQDLIEENMKNNFDTFIKNLK